jgi:hypothetical protein
VLEKSTLVRSVAEQFRLAKVTGTASIWLTVNRGPKSFVTLALTGSPEWFSGGFDPRPGHNASKYGAEREDGKMAKRIRFHTKYVHEDVAFVRQRQYRDGQIALEVVALDGEPLTVATVNMIDYGETPDEGNVFIYGDYSEHVGVWEALYKAGVVGPVIRRVPMQYDAEAYECKLLAEI